MVRRYLMKNVRFSGVLSEVRFSGMILCGYIRVLTPIL